MSERSGVVKPGKLFYMLGLPQSGKSLWANDWMSFFDKDGEKYINNALWCGESPFHVITPRVIVAGDDFRHALYGREFQIEAEGTVFAMMDVATRALLRRGFDVLIDETCTTEATLLRYLRIDLEATPIWIDTPVEVCKERALAAGRPYLIGPIERMAAQLENLRSNFDETVARLKAYLQQRKQMDVAV